MFIGFALGFLAGCVYYKYTSGLADIEAEAFVNGYVAGYSDRMYGHQQEYTIWDTARWRALGQ